MAVEVAITTRPHGGKGITAARSLNGHFFDRLLKRLGVIDRADRDAGIAAQRLGIERRNRGLEVDRRHPVLLPFFDLEGDKEALLVRIVFGQRRNDLHVGIAVLQIEAADQVAVSFDTVRIVQVTGGQEAEEVRLAGLDHVLQAVRRKRLVADELDRAHAGLGTFIDGEDQIDAIIGLLDDFRRDLNVIPARAAVDFGDAQRVGLHERPRQRAARLGLHLSRELFVLDLLITLERHASDHRVFHHDDHQPATGLVDAHVLEQAGLDQRLQAVVNPALIQPTTGAGLKIRTNGLHLDAAVTFDHDRTGALCRCRHRRQHGGDRGRHRNGANH